MSIRRTFHRTARDGLVKADGRLWMVIDGEQPYTGKVTLRINLSEPFAYYEINKKAYPLKLSLVKRIHETGI